MRQVFTSVQPKNEDHPRHGQAGHVCAIPADKPDEVGVKWDTDGDVTTEKTADLRAL